MRAMYTLRKSELDTKHFSGVVLGLQAAAGGVL